MKKTLKTFALTLLVCVASPSRGAMPEYLSGNYAKAIAFGAVSVATGLAKDPVKDFANNGTKLINVNAGDLIDMVTAVTLFKGLSYVFAPEHTLANPVLHNTLGTLAPTAIVGYIIATSQSYNKAFASIPVIGSHFACKQEDCKGVCNKCKLKKLRQSIFVAAGLSAAREKLNITKKCYDTIAYVSNFWSNSNAPDNNVPAVDIQP